VAEWVRWRCERRRAVVAVQEASSVGSFLLGSSSTGKDSLHLQEKASFPTNTDSTRALKAFDFSLWEWLSVHIHLMPEDCK